MSAPHEFLLYDTLLQKNKTIILLDTIQNQLAWDMDTKMPPLGNKLRAQQMGVIERYQHQLYSSTEYAENLKQVKAILPTAMLSPIQQRNITLIDREYLTKTSIPEELAVQIIQQRATAVKAWKKAKAAQDFTLFLPDLEKTIELKRKQADYLMKAKGNASHYDTMIDLFEPMMTSKMLSNIFESLKNGLISIIQRFISTQERPEARFLERQVPLPLQRQLSGILLEFLGFDTKSPTARGRLDETEHPFTIGYFDDVRITTHYYTNNFTSSLFSVLHEGGHALYEQNIAKELIFSPVGTPASYGIHESQSRLVENMIGRSAAFWSYFYPVMRATTGDLFSDVSLDQIVHAINTVHPSPIRVEADEATYSLHIIIRFEIERAIFEDDISVSELPALWNEKYNKYLDLDIKNDSEGLMQDTHWASGHFGYFPSYALGNVYSAQFFRRLSLELPDWEHQIEAGNFGSVKQWLIDNVHQHGNQYDPVDLVKHATGESPTPKYFLDYLRTKYSRLYTD